MKENISKIYERFRKPLFYFILRKISNKDIAEDLLHEVFIKAYEKFDTLEDEEKIQSWLYKIASNTIIDYFRKKQISSTEHTDLFFEEEIEESVLSELSCCLSTLLNELPKNQKNILEAVYFKEMSLLEYSQINNINISTVKSHSKRAKDKLKKVFDDCCIFQKNNKKEIIDYKHKDNKCLCNK